MTSKGNIFPKYRNTYLAIYMNEVFKIFLLFELLPSIKIPVQNKCIITYISIILIEKLNPKYMHKSPNPCNQKTISQSIKKDIWITIFRSNNIFLQPIN